MHSYSFNIENGILRIYEKEKLRDTIILSKVVSVSQHEWGRNYMLKLNTVSFAFLNENDRKNVSDAVIEWLIGRKYAKRYYCLIEQEDAL